MKHLKPAYVLLALLVLSGCSGCNKNKSREKPDVSGVQITVPIIRFDKDLFEFNNHPFLEQYSLMQSKYGPFFDFYLNHFIIGPRPAVDTANVDEPAIKKFITDSYIHRIQDSINLHFENTSDVEKELTQSFKYVKYYFPEIKTPNIAAVNSAFGVAAFTYDNNWVGVGLDLYLGPNNADYDSAGIYQYMQHKMRREYIARNAVEATYNLYFGDEEASRNKNLIEAMIDKGKKLYFLSYIFPDAPDSLLVGFTQKQTTWCEQSEYEIWKYLNEKDLLYKNNYMDHKRYLDEGPTTTGMPPEAPGNLGGWIGLQIVRKFVKETGGKISLHDLITKYDSKAILEKARYRPSKSVF